MGDWEEFCESKGMNVGSSEDYDRFIDSLEDKPKRTNPDIAIFPSFVEALEWSRENAGAAFTRTSDGEKFTPVKSRQRSIKRISSGQTLAIDLPESNVNEIDIKNLPADFSQITKRTSQQQLVDLLVNKYGFEFHVPGHSMWRGILTYTNNNESMYVLIRRTGVNIKFYESGHVYKFDGQGNLKATGGIDFGGYTNIKLRYTHGGESIHQRINIMACLFVNDKPLHANHYLNVEYEDIALASPPQYFEKEPKSLPANTETNVGTGGGGYDMREIYDN